MSDRRVTDAEAVLRAALTAESEAAAADAAVMSRGDVSAAAVTLSELIKARARRAEAADALRAAHRAAVCDAQRAAEAELSEAAADLSRAAAPAEALTRYERAREALRHADAREASLRAGERS